VDALKKRKEKKKKKKELALLEAAIENKILRPYR
jgi:hypothetical protein